MVTAVSSWEPMLRQEIEEALAGKKYRLARIVSAYRQEENLMVMGHGKKTISLQYSTRQAQNYDQKKLHRKG